MSYFSAVGNIIDIGVKYINNLLSPQKKSRPPIDRHFLDIKVSHIPSNEVFHVPKPLKDEADSYECNVYRGGSSLDVLKQLLKIRHQGLQNHSETLYNVNYLSISKYIINEFRGCDWAQLGPGQQVELHAKESTMIYYQSGVVRICLYILVPTKNEPSKVKLLHLRVNYLNWD